MTRALRRTLAGLLNVLAIALALLPAAQLFRNQWGWLPEVSAGAALVLLVLAVTLALVADDLRHSDDETSP